METVQKFVVLYNRTLHVTDRNIPAQGGIFTGNQGARFPRNLQTHTKFLQHFTLFWRKFDFKVCISCQMKKFFLSHTTCRKYFLATGRNFLALQVINCHRKKFIVTESIFYQGQKFLVTRRNFLLQGRISCQRQKCPVTGRNFLSQKETSCQRY